MNAYTGKPTREEQRVASESLYYIQAATPGGKASSVFMQIEGGGKSLKITIPDKAVELLGAILSNMAEGKATFVLTSDSELSTQQAADLLGASRPHVVKLLEEGIISFKKVGSHRRVLLEDLLDYQAELKENRKEKLKFLAEQAQNLELGY